MDPRGRVVGSACCAVLVLGEGGKEGSGCLLLQQMLGKAMLMYFSVN